jgi:hypothetical protein
VIGSSDGVAVSQCLLYEGIRCASVVVVVMGYLSQVKSFVVYSSWSVTLLKISDSAWRASACKPGLGLIVCY